VNGLEQRRLVRRQSHPTDRRVWLVEITDEGRSMVDRITEIDHEVRTQPRAGVTRVQWRQLAVLFDHIRSNAVLIIERTHEDVDEGLETTP
jgi:DNA-binding MarR family transcriptional regulator